MCAIERLKPIHTGKMAYLLAFVRFVRLWIDYAIDYLYSLYHSGKKDVISPANQRYLSLSATQMARKLQERVIKCEDLMQCHICRIKEVNKFINAVVDERFDDALKEAMQIDQDYAEGVITPNTWKDKPFLGVPFTSKESTHSKGMKISFGLVSRKNVRADEDADVVRLMKDSGAILIAVTNVPQLNLWSETHNPVYGITKNPYDTSRSVGGSSGGEAAIIAACGSPIGIGTDIGGSIRIPANMCGLFGHKTSSELTPTKGLTFRDGSEFRKTMVVTGPITRFSEDLIPGIKAMIGPAHKLLNLDVIVNVRKLKYYYVMDSEDLYMSTPRPDVVESMEKVINHFSEIAYTEKVAFPGTAHAIKLFKFWMTQEGTDFNYDITDRENHASALGELGKYVLGRSNLSFAAVLFMLNNTVMPSVSKSWAVHTTETLKASILKTLGDDGVLLYMSSPMVAQYHHSSYLRPFNVSNFCIFNFLKMPVTQVPLGLNEEGLPLGIQVVAAPMKDHLCIAVARELEKTFGGYVPPFKAASL